jgi:lysophospholipase L1-like esterase
MSLLARLSLLFLFCLPSCFANSSVSYEAIPIVNGSISVDAGSNKTYGVMLDSPLTSINLGGAVNGLRSEIDIVFTQGAAGGKKVTIPPNVKLPLGMKDVVETIPYRMTSVRFMSVDGGATWFAEKLATYDAETPPVFTLPPITGENATFTDEGTSAQGWAATNATVASSGSTISYTKPALGQSSILKAATKPPTTSDYILYARIRATYSADAVSLLQFYDMATGRTAGIWLGSADATTTPAPGYISIVGTTGNGTVRNTAVVASGFNYSSTWIDVALHWDSTYATLNCFFREADGRWKFKGRVNSEFVGGPNISAQFTPGTAAGSVMEMDFVTVAQPNLMSFGDSIAAGATLFNPNPAFGLVNDDSTWMRHAPIYQGLRNNLIVNKGVPGNTTAQSLARMGQINTSGAKVMFLSGPTNDSVQGVSPLATRGNVQAIVDSAATVGTSVVLLNQIYGTVGSAGNLPTPSLRDRGLDLWNNYLPAVTGVSAFIDIMSVLKGEGRFIDPSMAQSDGHPNSVGYAAMGDLISK